MSIVGDVLVHLPESTSQRGVEMVLHAVIGSTLQLFAYFGPTISELGVQLEQDPLLFMGPL